MLYIYILHEYIYCMNIYTVYIYIYLFVTSNKLYLLENIPVIQKYNVLLTL